MDEHFADRLRRTPTGPGVYLMKDVQGNILYVGKARNLKNRLTSYFKSSSKWNLKTNLLVQKIAVFDTILTESEKEALILESNLIKRHRPRYNVVLKDDKRYPSLRLDVQSDFPSLTIVRKPERDGALYFGPYASAQAVRETLAIVNKSFKLRKCKRKDFRNRTRPCLHCQMERCLAPCCMDIDPAVYQEMVKEAILFLKGRAPDLVRKIRQEMAAAAENQEFEKAARLRDKMFAIEKTIQKQVAVTTDFQDRDVLAIAEAAEQSLVTLLVVRSGYLTGTRHFHFPETMATNSDLMDAFIRQYYEKTPDIPKEILVSVAVEGIGLLEDDLRQLKGEAVRIFKPQRGEKARLISMARQNAQKELTDRIAALQAGERMLCRLQKRLKTQRPPHRIDCIDISNIQGTEPVAALVVFVNGKPAASLYRKYRIRTLQTPNDYAAMAEVIHRRYGKEKNASDFPDLLLVDGGKGQLNIATAVLGELDLSDRFDVAGIAKKDPEKGEPADKIYVPGRVNPVDLNRDEDLFLLLQRVRDEAHRVAIGFHRKRRDKRTLRSRLDGVYGVGKKRKEALLRHFGSIEKIRAATLDELSAVPGINRSIAAQIKSTI